MSFTSICKMNLANNAIQNCAFSDECIDLIKRKKPSRYCRIPT